MRQVRPRTRRTPVRPVPDRVSFSVDLRDRPTDSAESDGTDRPSEPASQEVAVDPDDRSVVPWGFFEDDDA